MGQKPVLVRLEPASILEHADGWETPDLRVLFDLAPPTRVAEWELRARRSPARTPFDAARYACDQAPAMTFTAGWSLRRAARST